MQTGNHNAVSTEIATIPCIAYSSNCSKLACGPYSHIGAEFVLTVAPV